MKSKYITLGIVEEDYSTKNKYLNLDKDPNSFVGLDSDDSRIWGNPNLITGNFKILNHSETLLYFLFNGFTRRLHIIEKDNFENQVYIDVQQVMKNNEGNWMITIGFTDSKNDYF